MNAWYLLLLAAAVSNASANLEVSVVANVSFNQVRIGDTVVLTCSLASDTNVTNPLYTWMYVDREETLSETSNMLILFEIMSDQFGTYRCGISSDGELASANITIMQAFVIGFESESYLSDEGRGRVTLVIRSSIPNPGPEEIFLSIQTENGTALAGLDYRAVSDFVIFQPMEQVKEYDVEFFDDNMVEIGVETYSVVLAFAVGIEVMEGFSLGIARTTIFLRDINTVIIQLDPTSVRVSEDSGEITIVVKKEGASEIPTAVFVDTRDSTAIAAMDYVEVRETVVFEPEVTEQNLTLTLVNDDILEEDEVFLVELSIQEGAPVTLLDTTRVTSITILNDDTVTFHFQSDQVFVTEGISESVIVTVVKEGSHAIPLTVSVETNSIDARAGEDYESISTQLTFDPEDASLNVSIMIVNDNVMEVPDRFSMVLGPTRADTLIGEPRQIIVVIIDDDDGDSGGDVTEVGFSPTSYSVEERETSVELTIMRTGSTTIAEQLSVQYFTMPATASENMDYVPVSSTIATFSENESSIRVTIQITNDNVLEVTEELFFVRVELVDDRPGVLLRADTATVLITDDDGVIVRWQPRDYVVIEPVGLVGLRMTYEGQTDIGISVIFSTLEEEADGQDYLNTTELVTFDVNRNETFVSLIVFDDTIYEGSETLLAMITPVTLGVMVEGGPASITIEDDEDFPAINFDGVGVIEVDEGFGVVSITIRKATPNAIPVSVNVRTMDDTATAPGDYIPIDIDLTFEPTDEEAVVNITIVEDRVLEFTESFQVVITTIVNGQGMISLDRLFVFILDSSPGIMVSFEQDDFTVDENLEEGIVLLSVVVSNELERTIELMLATVDGTAVAGRDYEETAMSFTFVPGDNQIAMSVRILNDDVLEGDEQFSVILSASESEGVVLVDSIANITILDEDFITMSFEPAEYTVSENNGSVTLRLVKIGENDITVSVTFNTEDRSAFGRIEQLDYVPVAQRIEFQPGVRERFITITILDNDAVEGVELFYGQLAIPPGEIGVNLEADRASVFIVDEDVVLVSFSQPEYTTSEDEPSVLVTIIKTGESQVIVEVEFSVIEDTAAGNLDYIPDSRVIRFDLSQDTQQASVQIFDDGTYEGLEQFIGVLRIISNEPGILAPENTTIIKIQDNDFVTVGFDRVDYVVTESQNNVSLTFSKRGAAVVPVTVTVITMVTAANNSATAGEDFEPVNMDVVLFPGDTAASFVVEVVNDDTLEGIEVFLVELFGGPGVRITDEEATVQIIDEDAARVGFTETKYTVFEDDGIAMVCVEKSAQIEFSFEIQVTTLQGSATAETDYRSLQQALTFFPSDQELCVSVPLLNNEVLEDTEEFQLSLELQDTQFEQEERIAVAPMTTTVSIIDDDAVSIELEETSYIVDEGENVTVRVLKSGQSLIATRVGIILRPGSAFAGSDYSPLLIQSLTFDPSEQIKELIIATTMDDIVEDNEIFSVELVSRNEPGVALGVRQSAPVEITDDDVVLLGFEQASYTVLESSDEPLSIIVTKSGRNERPVTVSVITVDGTATRNRDYNGSLLAESVTFESGDETQSLILSFIDDSFLEFDENIRLLLSLDPDEIGVMLLFGLESANITLLDDDFVVVGFLQTEARIDESVGNVQFPVTFTGLAVRPFTIEVETTDGTAVASRDYVLLTEELIFSPVGFLELVTVQIFDDAVFEGNEEFNVSLSVPANERGVHFDTLSVRVIIQDDDRLQFAFEETTYSVVESSGLVTVNISKLGQYESPVSMAIFLESGTAREILDFGFPIVNILTFSSQDSVLPFSIPINDDLLVERNETFSARLIIISSEEQGVSVLPESDTTTIEIIDDDFVTVGFATSSIVLEESNVVLQEPLGAVEIEVLLLEGIADRTFKVQVMTVEGTARESQDYERLFDVLTFRRTESSKSVRIVIVMDTIAERDEEFDVVLSSEDNNVILDPAVLTIRILDFLDLSVGFESTELAVSESDSFVEISVAYQGGAVDAPTSFGIVTFDGSATSPGDYEAVDGVVRFEPLQQRAFVQINITDDQALERTEFFFVRLSDVIFVSQNEVVVQIIDNDEVQFSFDQDVYAVGEETETVSLQVVKFGSSDIPVTVLLTTISGTALASQDYQPIINTMPLTFAPDEDIKSVTITVIDNIIVEDLEEFVVELLTPDVGRGLSLVEPFQSTVQIVDNDQVTIGFQRDSYEFVENSSLPVFVNIIKQGQNAIPITVTLFLEGGSAIANEDFVFQPLLNVTFSVDDEVLPISLTLIDDLIFEDDEGFFAFLSVPVEEGGDTMILAEEGTTSITILDNDVVIVGFEQIEFRVEETSGIDVEAFVVLLEGVAEREFSVSIETIDGTARAPNDYTALSANLTFEPSTIRQQVTIDIIFDNALEPSETFTIQLHSTDDRVLIDSTRMLQQVIIDDNSDGLVGFEVIQTQVAESATFVNLLVALRGRFLEGTLTLQYNTMDGTAAAPMDYEKASEIITFTSAQTEVVIRIEINDDEFFERNESFDVQLEFIGGDVFAFVIPDRTTIVIEDNDVIMISGGDVMISENNGTVVICFELNHFTEVPITVGVVFTARENSTSPAEGGVDYVNEDLSLTFHPGEVISCTQAAILADSEIEEPEEFCANIVSDDPRIQSLGGECDVTITILDTTEPPPAVCTVQDPLIVVPFLGPMSTQLSYNFHSTCEHILLAACNMNPSIFRITVDFISSNLDMGRIGIALNEARIIILEDVTILSSNLGPPLSISSGSSEVVYTNGVTITQEDGVAIVELSSIGVIVTRQRIDNMNTIIVNVTREGTLSEVCGLCGTLDGVLLHSDRTTVTQFADRNAIEIFADSWRVNPGKQFLREERRECGFLGNDTIIGDPLFSVPLYDKQGSAPVIPKTTNATPPSLCFEIHGAADQVFNLVSDRCTSVNAHYFPMNISNNGNIIGSVGIRAVNRIGECVDVTVDLSDGCVPRVTQGNVTQSLMRYNSDGIFVSSRRDRVRVSVPNCEGVQLVMWVMCEDVQGQEMIKFVISRGINLHPSSHGLLGQFWNIPITLRPLNYTGSNTQLISDYFNVDRLYEITVNPPSSQPRTFVGELFHRSWDQKGVRCFYAGSAQGGRLSEFETHADTVIEGRYFDYRVSGLHETEFKYSQFSSSFC